MWVLLIIYLDVWLVLLRIGLYILSMRALMIFYGIFLYLLVNIWIFVDFFYILFCGLDVFCCKM